jgi:hypothetical protein
MKWNFKNELGLQNILTVSLNLEMISALLQKSKNELFLSVCFDSCLASVERHSI